MTACLPLPPRSLSAAIAERLRQRILQGEWAPGADLHEGTIAASLGVPRTPVREAMQLLCREGVLTAGPQRGMAVTVLSPAQIQEAHALHQWLQAQLLLQAPVPGGLMPRMLEMAAQRLALAPRAVTPADIQRSSDALPSGIGHLADVRNLCTLPIPRVTTDC